MKYRRLFEDEEGDSHWENVPVQINQPVFVPTSPDIGLSDFNEAKRYAFLHLPVSWEGDLHPTPKRQLIISVLGNIEIEASDGETHRFPAGHAVLLEDTEGKGHITRVIGNSDVLATVIQLED
jgi:hypothetical protein